MAQPDPRGGRRFRPLSSPFFSGHVECHVGAVSGPTRSSCVMNETRKVRPGCDEGLLPAVAGPPQHILYMCRGSTVRQWWLGRAVDGDRASENR